MERTKLSTLVALALLSSGIAVSAYSASGPGMNNGPTAKERGSQARADRPAAQQGDRQWASDLIGKNVTLAGGRKGEIEDFHASLAGLAEIALPNCRDEIRQVENILAGVAAAWALDIAPDLIRDGIKNFHRPRAHAPAAADADKTDERNPALELPC